MKTRSRFFVSHGSLKDSDRFEPLLETHHFKMVVAVQCILNRFPQADIRLEPNREIRYAVDATESRREFGPSPAANRIEQESISFERRDTAVLICPHS